MDTWVAQGGQRFGPFSQEKLREMLSSGQIAASADVWVPETSQWVKAQELPGFRRPDAPVAPLADEAPPPVAPPVPPPPAPVPPPSDSPSTSGSPSGASPSGSPSQASAWGSPSGPSPSEQQSSYPVPYGASGAVSQQTGPKTNQIALAALIVGVLSLLSLIMIFTLVLAFAPAVLGILAIVLGFVGRSQVKRTGEQGGGFAIGGIVTGALTLVVLAALIVLIVFGLMRLSEEAGPIINRACSQAVQADLREAATTQEMIFIERRSYTRSVADLADNGWVSTAQTTNCMSSPLTIESATETDYCMEMAGGGQTFAITTNGLREGDCGPLG